MMSGVKETEVQLTFSELVETGFIKCILCKSQYRDPRLLPCLHTFCKSCIEQLQKTGNQSSSQNFKASTRKTKDSGSDTDDSASDTQDQLENGDDQQVDTTEACKNETTNLTIVCPICKSTIGMPATGGVPFPVNAYMQDLCEMYDYKHEKERHCDYCKYENKVTLATSLCLDCHDNMCVACTAAHNKTKVTRCHKVIPYAQVQKGLYDKDIRECQQQTCTTHPDEALCMFCEKCETLMCKECKVSSHDDHKWMTTDKAVTKYQTQIQKLLRGINQQIPAVHKYLSFLSNYGKSVEASRAKQADSIEKQAELLHKMVDEQKIQCLESLAEVTDKEACQIQVKAGNLRTAAISLEDNEKFLGNLLHTGNAEEILQLHISITARLTQLMNMQLDGLTSQLRLNFTSGNASERNIQTIFGKLAIDDVAFNNSDDGMASGKALQISALLPDVRNTAELMSQFDAEGKDDKKDIWPTGMAMTRSDSIVIADRDNKSIKIYTRAGKLIHEITGSGDNKLGSPFDVAVLKSGNIAVTDHEAENVKVFKPIGEHVLTINEGIKYPRGITVNSKGEIIILDCQLKCLTIHDPNTGTKIKTIDATNAKGSKVLVDPYYVTVSPQDNLIVTDTAAPNIKVFSQSGQYLANYGNYGMRKDEILQPFGVCCDAYGYIFVADNQNHRIHLLLPNGKFSKFLLTKSDCLWHPMGLAITQDGHLALTEALGKIKVFKYI